MQFKLCILLLLICHFSGFINQTAAQMDNLKLSDNNGTALKSIFLINSGDGPNSYAANSSNQRDAMVKARSILEESVKRVYIKTLSSTNQFTVADLGCATGPNTLKAATTIIEAIFGLCSQAGKSTPEILVFLNDLPGNDFNSVFGVLPDFYDKLKLKEGDEALKKCFVSVMPGSFYGKLFPSRSLHFVHSAMSVHWLSQVPNGLEHNKGNVYMATTSSDGVWEAYLKQFQRDFTLFLCSRAHEVVSKGEMVLTMICRITSDPRDKHSLYRWELLSKCLLEMAAEGLVKEKDIDSFNLPIYLPYEEEVRDLVEKEASFVINKLETIQQNIGPFNCDKEDTKLTAAKMSLTIRALMEPLLTRHFGGGPVMNELFKRFETKMADYLSSETTIIAAFLILSATNI